MFGFFKKKAPAGCFILVAVEAAVALRAAEQKNGGLYTPPELIMPTVKSIAKKNNCQLEANVAKVTESCVMAFLMEQAFVDRLVERTHRSGIGILTEHDEEEVSRITKEVLAPYRQG